MRYLINSMPIIFVALFIIATPWAADIENTGITSREYISSDEYSLENKTPDIPHEINYQGYLSDNNGNPITATLNMEFAIYPSETGGSSCWNDAYSVTVTNGIFDVILGSITPIPTDCFTDGSETWLQLTIEGELLTPRIKLTSIGYGFVSEQADMVDGHHYSPDWEPDGYMNGETAGGDLYGTYPNPSVAWADTAGYAASAAIARPITPPITNNEIGDEAVTWQKIHWPLNFDMDYWDYLIQIEDYGGGGIIELRDSSNSQPTLEVRNYGNDNAIYARSYGDNETIYARNTGEGKAIYAISDDNDAIYAKTYSTNDEAVYGYAEDGGANGIRGQNPTSSNSDGCGVYYSGGLAGSGTKSCVVRTSKGPTLFYCQESPENWFEDFGSGQLRNGKAHVDLDLIFLEAVTITDDQPLKVFIQLNGECNGVYVVKDPAGFDVIEFNNGKSNVSFDWRAVAKRMGVENERLEICQPAFGDPLLYPERVEELDED